MISIINDIEMLCRGSPFFLLFFLMFRSRIFLQKKEKIYVKHKTNSFWFLFFSLKNILLYFLVQAPSRPVPTITFQACMLLLLRESCTVSWLNAKDIPIHQNNLVVTLHSLSTSFRRKSIKTLVFIKFAVSSPIIIYKYL